MKITIDIPDKELRDAKRFTGATTMTRNGAGPSLAAGACGGAVVPCPTQSVQKSSTMSI